MPLLLWAASPSRMRYWKDETAAAALVVAPCSGYLCWETRIPARLTQRSGGRP
jgi:hypothetical protein